MSDVDLQRDELLQRFLDGDLSVEQAHEVRELMRADPSVRAGAQTYRRLGEMVRELAHAETLEEDMDRVWQRVRSGVEAERTDDISGPSPARVWFSEFFRHRKRVWIPASAATAAAAAALVLALHLPGRNVPVEVPVSQDLRSRVTDISLNSASTMVFEVETESGGTATILWVTPEEQPEAGEAGGQEGEGP
jgi:anti-sigma factor RsiW